MSKDGKLVWSSDPEEQMKIEMKGGNFAAVLRIEKQGRGGKTVTVIDGLPKVEVFLKEWTTRLKKKCGSGGTYITSGKEGVIEIQGDKRDLIRAEFTKAGIRVKG
jgi:translation initiation factor 1